METALERGIFLDIFAILIERRGADGMKLAARKSGLEHIARVHGRIARGTRAHDGMQLVDEQDDAPIALLHFPQNRLQAVFEFTAIFRASNHRAQIERNNVMVFQAGRNVAGNDTLRQAFNNRRFAHAGLANEHGIVLRTSGKHLNGAANFFGTPDNRVELAFASLLSEVLPILVQGIELGFALLVGHARIAAQLVVGLFDIFARNSGVRENLARLPVVFGQRDEQMLARGVGIAHFLGDLHRIVEHLDKVSAGNGHAHNATRDLRAIFNGLIDGAFQHRRIGAYALDDGGEIVLARIEQRLQQMNRFDRRCVGVTCDAHGSLKCFLGRNGQFIESHTCISFLVGRASKK